MAKQIKLEFAMDGKLEKGFADATKTAGIQLRDVGNQVKAISSAAQKRMDAAAFKNLGAAAKATGKSFGSLKQEITGTILAVSGVTAAAGGAVYGIASASANIADDAVKQAQSVGMATEAFTELSYAAGMAGVSQGEFASSSMKLSKTVKNAMGGNKTALDAFARAGVNLTDGAGKVKNTEQLYAELAAQFASMPDGIGKTALAMELFGKSGGKLIPFLNGGSGGMAEMREEAKRLGVSISDADAKNAEAFNDSFANIQKAISGVSLTIGKELWPALTDVHNAISGWISQNNQLLAQKLPEWIDAAKTALREAKPQIMAVWESVKGWAASIDGIAQGMGGWIPTIERLVKAWIAYRGVRIGLALAGTASNVYKLGAAFVEAAPAMGRWIVNSKLLALPGKVMDGFTSLIWKLIQGTGWMIKFSAVIIAKGASALASFASSVYAKATPALASLAGAIWKNIVVAGRFAVALAVKGATAIASFAASAGAGIVTALTGMATGLAGAATAAWGFAAALLANPITWIVAGIAALGVGIYYLWKNWDAVVEWFSGAWETMKSTASAACDAIATAAAWIYDEVSPVFSGIYDAVSGAFQKIVDFVSWAGDEVSSAADAVGGAIASAAAWVYDEVSAIFGGIYDAVSGALGRVVEYVGDFAGTMWNDIKGYFSGGISEVVSSFEGRFVGGLVSAVKTFHPVRLIAQAINAVVRHVAGVDLSVSFGAMFDTTVDYLKGLGGRFYNIGSEIVQAMIDGIIGMKDKLISYVGDMIKSIPGIEYISGALNAAGTVASAGADYVASGAGTVASGVGKAFDSVSGWLGFANGGVVDRPQLAMVGEAGPEVIVPVSRPGRAHSLLGAAADMMGLGGGSAGAGGITVSYSPSFTITGAGDPEALAARVDRSLGHSLADLRRMLDDIMRDNRRVALR